MTKIKETTSQTPKQNTPPDTPSNGHQPKAPKLPFPAQYQTTVLLLCPEHPEWVSILKASYFDDPLEARAFNTLRQMPPDTRSLKTWYAAFMRDIGGKPAAQRVFRPFVKKKKKLTKADRKYVESKLSQFLKLQQYAEALLQGAKFYERQDVSGMAKLFERTMDGVRSLETADDLVSLKQLRAKPLEKVKWLVEGRLRIGGLSLIAGKPGVGKGTCVRCLASAVARGSAAWLGFSVMKKGPVLYIAGVEEHEQEVKDHFDRMGAANTDPIFMRFSEAPQEPIPYLRAMITRHKLVLIIIDGMSSFLRSPAGATQDYDAMGRALDPLLGVARDTGVHILLIHHTGKTERSDPFDAILGSSAIRGKPDTRIAFRNYPGKYRTLQSEQRYGSALPETTLLYDAKTGMVTAGLLRTAADAAHVEQRILDYLAKVGKPVPEEALEHAALGKTQAWKQALRHLVKFGKVRRVDKHGKPNTRGGQVNPFHYVPAKRRDGGES
jgi:hypothetical protein